MPQKILFVCLGNICRSPLAEGIMLHLNAKYELDLKIDSAGTASYHIGEAPDKRTIQNALKNGVDLRELRARQFLKEDFDNFDRIFVMDKNNFHSLHALADNVGQKAKIDYFLNNLYEGENKDVPDPYYGTSADFENVFQLVYATCEQLCTKLKGISSQF